MVNIKYTEMIFPQPLKHSGKERGIVCVRGRERGKTARERESVCETEREEKESKREGECV